MIYVWGMNIMGFHLIHWVDLRADLLDQAVSKSKTISPPFWWDESHKFPDLVMGIGERHPSPRHADLGDFFEMRMRDLARAHRQTARAIHLDASVYAKIRWIMN